VFATVVVIADAVTLVPVPVLPEPIALTGDPDATQPEYTAMNPAIHVTEDADHE
jgi:hypothetical protein